MALEPKIISWTSRILSKKVLSGAADPPQNAFAPALSTNLPRAECLNTLFGPISFEVSRIRPIVIVNFKTYARATGERAVWLARMCEEAGENYDADVRVAVQATDIHLVAGSVGIPVYAQHLDPVSEGRHTGFVTAEALREAGAKGALINHSEHRLSKEDTIVATILSQKAGLETVVFVEDETHLRLLQQHIRPDYFCIEPPDLIAGEVSVSVAKPSLVKEAVHASLVPVLAGAGVKRYMDLEMALEFGAKGAIVASGIVLADHKEKAFQTLLSSNPAHRKD